MKKEARPRGVDAARLIKVIETKAIRGKGNENDVCRMDTQ